MSAAARTLPATSTVDPEEVAKFSAIADEWWDPKGKFAPLHKLGPARIGYVKAQIEKHFGGIEGLALLDIGCGGGLMCEPMARLGAAVTGIDASEKNIAMAGLHAEQQGLNIDYRATTAEELAASKKQYDVVMALEIIEHVASPELFMQHVCGLVKPGGLLFLSTINRTAKSFALAIVGAEYILRWLPRGTHDWKKFLTPGEMAAMVAQHGMKARHTAGVTFNPLNGEWSLHPTDVAVNYMMTVSSVIKYL
ncbi:bifunctional 2-polyprenyl-6-hydroxyphenol methylase/3-demethylubiquinol 3-O-methyltransferase UbiG [bacterium]|nr:bifunctional 2-polyprenyl-6-hydroxyphenol methylase/3-demethylubiquinol 3-O-methyltransferase UbiG [bacterium]